MIQLLVVPLCLIGGILLQRNKEFRQHGPQLLNQIILNLFLPALILANVPGIFRTHSIAQMILPAMMPWLNFGFAALVIGIFGKALNWKRDTIGGLTLVTGLGNTSFVGIPLIDALYGQAGMDTLMIIDQLGSFLIANTIAAAYAAHMHQGHFSPRALVHQLSKYPPFYALILSMILVFVPAFDVFNPMLSKLGMCLAPLAMISAGLQLALNKHELKNHRVEIIVSLIAKMAVFPALIFFAYRWAGLKDLPLQVTTAEAAMAPMFTAGIIAMRFHLRPQLANLIIFIGVVLSTLTVPLTAVLVRN